MWHPSSGPAGKEEARGNGEVSRPGAQRPARVEPAAPRRQASLKAVSVCVCVRPSVCLSPASEKALLRDSSPASGTDRDSPEPLLKADPDHKELDSKSPDEIDLWL